MTRTWRVPGRIEVLGKHTDYAGGRVLVCAIDRGVTVTFTPGGRALRATTDAFPGSLDLGPDAPALPPGHWGRYVATAADRLTRNFGALAPGKLRVASDLPPASGMSSSSALICGVTLALADANGLLESEAWRDACPTRLDLAGYLACVENGRDWRGLPGSLGVGTLGGSEDHVAMICGEPGVLSAHSFDPLATLGRVPLPADLSFVVAVSGVRAEKTGAARDAYNAASRAASDVLARWNATSGRRDASLAAAVAADPGRGAGVRDALGGDPALTRRLEQFLAESERILPAALDALAAGDLDGFGVLVDASQRAADEGLRNQIAETRFLAASARERGAVAASAFGAGFGGSVWALVPTADAGAFASGWLEEYRERFPGHQDATTLVTRPGRSAHRTDA